PPPRPPHPLPTRRSSDLDLPQLSFVHTAIGSCYSSLCNFPEASRHLRKGLEIAERIGDDSRASRILSNLTMVCTTLGRYEDAIQDRKSTRLNSSHDQISY